MPLIFVPSTLATWKSKLRFGVFVHFQLLAMSRFLTAVTRLAAVAPLVGCVAGINLTVSTSGGNATSPLMYGFMFEVSGLAIES